MAREQDSMHDGDKGTLRMTAKDPLAVAMGGTKDSQRGWDGSNCIHGHF